MRMHHLIAFCYQVTRCCTIAFNEVLSITFAQLRCSANSTPKYLLQSVYSMESLPHHKAVCAWDYLSRCLKCIAFDWFGFIVTPLPLHHSLNTFKEFCTAAGVSPRITKSSAWSNQTSNLALIPRRWYHYPGQSSRSLMYRVGESV